LYPEEGLPDSFELGILITVGSDLRMLGLIGGDIF
jgi:hypothetical protein